MHMVDECAQNIKSPVQFIKHVGPQKAKQLAKLGINTVEDLLYHFPRSYEDRRLLKKVSQVVPGALETIQGIIIGLETSKPRPKLTIVKAFITDGSGTISAVWFNQEYLKRRLKLGARIIITGKISRNFGVLEIIVRDYEILSSGHTIHSGRIVPIYPSTEKLGQRFLRVIIRQALESHSGTIPEVLPEQVLRRRNLPSLPWAMEKIHFPDSWEEQKKARERLAYQELFLLQAALAVQRNKLKQANGISHQGKAELLSRFMASLSFQLTGAQQRVWQEIARDMETKYPMIRMVQGDVGSGKTVIACAALLKSVASGYQSAMMAPTEILAQQHFQEVRSRLEPFGVKVSILTSNISKKDKQVLLNKVAAGQVDVLIGTHALIQEEVQFKCLSLVVIDEQHRFGVRQRALLEQKGSNPDLLVMTATPIPRTLALTFYGDLDISIIDEMPPGRKPVLTRYVPEGKREQAYQFIRQELEKGRQAFVVCPLIEESDHLQVEAAIEMARRLEKDHFAQYEIGLLHGKLSQQEKERVISDFRKGHVQVLVATTVIEVGVNIPNATVMLIEGAERFGLAQLHQLRGRIGRGNYQSYCLLMGNPKTQEGKARLAIMTNTSDGFKIAEQDLKLRGPGDFFGTRQHGLPELKVADLVKDTTLLQWAREDAFRLCTQTCCLPEPLGSIVQEKYSQINV